jgi:hypothetical protein
MRPIRIWTLSLVLVVAACSTPAAELASQPTAVPPTTAPPPAATATEVPAPTQAPPTPEPTAAATEPAPTEDPAAESPTPPLLSGAFVKEEVAVTGSYTLDPATNVLRLSDDFGLSDGPDLRVILSGASDLTVNYIAFSRLVIGSPRLYLGRLQSPSGAQAYVVPPGTDLSPYKTVVIWCEAFSVAFAAAPLQP